MKEPIVKGVYRAQEPGWRWVANVLRDETITRLVKAQGYYRTDQVKIGMALRRPAVSGTLLSFSTVDPAGGQDDMVGLYVRRDEWIRWFRRANPGCSDACVLANLDFAP